MISMLTESRLTSGGGYINNAGEAGWKYLGPVVYKMWPQTGVFVFVLRAHVTSLCLAYNVFLPTPHTYYFPPSVSPRQRLRLCRCGCLCGCVWRGGGGYSVNIITKGSDSQ